jgi:Family of unknown function (DUF6515)
MKRIMSAAAGVALIAVLALAAAHVQAQPYHDRGGPARAEHYDARYSHNHYYVNRGAFVRSVPGSPFTVARGGTRYYYSGGVWYAPRAGGFVVIGAPIGVFVPVLPPFYTTVWVGGLPYYYANDTYYVWSADQSGYEVVDPPTDQGATTTQPPPSDDLYIYPQSGQSEEQQANDKYECHKWASSQSGFDPTQAAGGVSPDQAAAKRAEYDRAMRACLEGRGYSVR